jgi:DNA replication protein DnaC
VGARRGFTTIPRYPRVNASGQADFKLLTDLRAGRGDGTHERRLARYCGVDLLIIDDLGLRGLNGDEPLDLYEIIRQRYERGSTIITCDR